MHLLPLPDVDPETLMSAVGSLVFMMISCGELIAPTLAGSLYDALGFQWTMSVGALMALLTGTTLLLTLLRFGNGEIAWCKCDGERNGKKKEMSDGEKEALLATFALSH